MIKDVKNFPISQLFDIEARVVYAIPRYQREYTWRVEQWEALFDDIEENDIAQFLEGDQVRQRAADVAAAN